MSNAKQVQLKPVDQSSEAGSCETEAAERVRASRRFMRELLESVETLTAIADTAGPRTLADLFYLSQAILNGGFVDHYGGESKLLEFVGALPSAETWLTFIRVEGKPGIPTRPYRPIDVTGTWLPVGTTVPGYSNGWKWHGFEQPSFPRDSVLQLMQLMPEVLAFDQVARVVRVTLGDDEPLYVQPGQIEVEGVTIEAYAIGDGWCWEAV